MADRAPRGRLPSWWRRRSLRARLTLLATLVVAAGLAAGSVLLTSSLERSLVAAVDGTARQRAQDVAALAEQDRLPDPLPAAGGAVLLQVVDAGDRVVAASVGSDQAVSLLPPDGLAKALDRRPRFLEGSRVGQDAPLRVVAWPVTYRGEPVTVIAAASFAGVEHSIGIVRAALVLGVPVLLILIAGTAWVTVGSALRPVGALRRGADEITGAGGSRRLPYPAARDEIHRLAETLNRMLDRLDEAGHRQRAFVADAAHELRTPLAAMRTQLEVALAHPEPAGWSEVAANVLQDALRLGRTVEDLLALAQLDDRRATAPAAEVDLGEVTRRVAGRVAGPATHVELRVETARALVRGDEAALGRVVQNLLDNALRHATSRVEVAVRTDGPPESPHALLVVTDDGPGIPPADRERVFERFTRLDDARSPDIGGTGLGLAIVREIVRAHHGEVTIEDPPAGRPGVRLMLRLPAEPATESAEGTGSLQPV